MCYSTMTGLADDLQIVSLAEQTFNEAGEVCVALEGATFYKVMHLSGLLDEPLLAHTALELVLL